MKFIEELDLKGKRVFIRVDFNVPLDENGLITDDHRIRAALPTIRYAIEAGGRIVVASHMGRPKGKRVEKFSLAPVAKRLGELLSVDVTLAPDCIGEDVEKMSLGLAEGEVLLLENLRFHKGETDNDQDFVKRLATLADVFINDAFAVSHRAHASVVGVPGLLDECGAGFLLKNEVTYFKKALESPQRPLLAILGGAKVSSKLGAIKNIIPLVDFLIIGGAMANTFLKASGNNVAASLVEDDLLEAANDIMKQAVDRGVKLMLPVDCVTATEMSEDAEATVCSVKEVSKGQMIFDIGPETERLFKGAVADAATIVWNGPVGAFELKPFSKGTINLAHAVGASSALSIIGGGDTDAAVHVAGEVDNVSYMSTGGGAFLTLLEGKKLPGFEALDK